MSLLFIIICQDWSLVTGQQSFQNHPQSSVFNTFTAFKTFTVFNAFTVSASRGSELVSYTHDYVRGCVGMFAPFSKPSIVRAAVVYPGLIGIIGTLK